MTALQQGEGIRLLAREAAAETAGVTVETIWAWQRMGFIKPVETPVGLRYPLHEIQAVLAGEVLPPPASKITQGQVARLLRVDSRTVSRAVRDGRLARDHRGRFDRAEVLALDEARQGRKALKPYVPPKTS